MNQVRIGLNMDVEDDGKSIVFRLREPYVRALRAVGARPVPLAPAPPEAAPNILEGVDGLLLTGGDDLDPVQFGGGYRHPDEVPLHPLREAFDLALLRAAERAGLPVLGICLGMQEMCAVHGGELHRFIAEDLPGAGRHRPENGKGLVTHDIEAAPGSILERLFGARFSVNSGHRQAVSRPGAGLKISGRAPDGVIEALEGESPGFYLGVQWHPELLDPNHEGLRLFTALIEAARTRRS